MKWRILVVGSVLLNAALVAAYFTKARTTEAPTSTDLAATPQIKIPRNDARSVRPSTVEVTTTNGFQWASVESPDYREYIANLRAIGCPEETIRDIVIADVNKLFGSRIAALYPTAKDYKFWRVEDRAAREEDRAREQKRRQIDKEKRALIKELLGIDYDVEMARWSGRSDDEDLRHGFLSTEKQEVLKSIQSKYREMERAAMGDGGFRNPENRAKVAALRAQREAELAQALGPQDYQENQLRNSNTARNMRENLTAFQPTEDEFRQIFDARKQFDDQFGLTRDGGDQAAREQRQAAQAKLDEQLRAVLGEERYHEYTLAQDDRYREMYDFTERNNLPRIAADALLDIRNTAEQARRELQNNKNLTPEQQVAARQQIQQTTDEMLAQTLGPKADDYLKTDGRWVNKLGPRDENNQGQRGPNRGGRPIRQ